MANKFARLATFTSVFMTPTIGEGIVCDRDK